MPCWPAGRGAWSSYGRSPKPRIRARRRQNSPVGYARSRCSNQASPSSVIAVGIAVVDRVGVQAQRVRQVDVTVGPDRDKAIATGKISELRAEQRIDVSLEHLVDGCDDRLRKEHRVRGRTAARVPVAGIVGKYHRL